MIAVAAAVVAGPTEVARPHIGVIWVKVDAATQPAFIEALALRLPQADVIANSERQPDTEGLIALVEVESISSRTHVQITMSDGRAFERLLESNPGDAEVEQAHALARHVAILLLGIEAGSELPDREDATLEVTPPKPASPPSEDIAAQRVVVEVATNCPPVVDASIGAESSSTGLVIGVSLGLPAVLGVGPPASVDRFAGWGVDLRTSLHWPTGALLQLEGRYLTRGQDSQRRLHRTRVRLAGGYVWRPSPGFEFEAGLGVLVEPWWVVAIDSSQSTLSGDPALGGSLHLAGGALWSRGRATMRFGARLDLALAGVPWGRPNVGRVVARTDNGADPLFRVGGFELGASLDWAVQFRSRR